MQERINPQAHTFTAEECTVGAMVWGVCLLQYALFSGLRKQIKWCFDQSDVEGIIMKRSLCSSKTCTILVNSTLGCVSWATAVIFGVCIPKARVSLNEKWSCSLIILLPIHSSLKSMCVSSETKT